jgi:predicted HicB family RNase H-like nuclease
MKTVSHRGYQASVEFDDGVLFVKVLHIDDLLIGQCDAAHEAQKVVTELVDAYIEDCAEAGREPAKPFKGSLNVRMSPETHRLAAMAAAENGITLNAWICEAVSEKLGKTKRSDHPDRSYSKRLTSMPLSRQ